MAKAPNKPIDVKANRASVKWTPAQQVRRVLWALSWPLFTCVPRHLWAWRPCLLRVFGAKVGQGVRIYPSVKITMPWNLSIGNEATIGPGAILYALGPISIGKRATVSQHAHLCAGTHDVESTAMDLLKTPISIGDDAWICADAFIGPGVTVGKHAVVGARAVAMKDVAADTIVAGNPAKALRKRVMR